MPLCTGPAQCYSTQPTPVVVILSPAPPRVSPRARVRCSMPLLSMIPRFPGWIRTPRALPLSLDRTRTPELPLPCPCSRSGRARHCRRHAPPRHRSHHPPRCLICCPEDSPTSTASSTLAGSSRSSPQAVHTVVFYLGHPRKSPLIPTPSLHPALLEQLLVNDVSRRTFPLLFRSVSEPLSPATIASWARRRCTAWPPRPEHAFDPTQRTGMLRAPRRAPLAI